MKKITLSLILIIIASFGYSQESQSKKSKKELRKERREKKANEEPHKGSYYITPLPVIGQNPAWGFMYGAAVSSSWYMGDPSNTNISSVLVGATLTTKDQFLGTIKGTTYFNENKWKLDVDWRFLNTSQPTYGLGTGPQSAKAVGQGFEISEGVFSAPIPDEQLMLYNFYRFHQTLSYGLKDNFYIGIGYHFDKFTNVRDNLLDTISDPKVITSYYAYNKINNLNQKGSTLSGVSINLSYDSRDNVNSTYEGRYALASFRYNPEFIGSDVNSSSLWLEYRDYYAIKDYKNIIAFWLFGNFQTSGTLPYMDLPALGYDQMSNSGRAYAQGRFRGQNLVYTELEYRRILLGTKNNPDFFGAVVFANATSASNTDANIGLFNYIDPAVGLGLRFMVEKKSRTILAIDYAWGKYGASGIYLALNQAF